MAGASNVLQDFSVLHRLSEEVEEDISSFWGRMTIQEFLEEKKEEERQMLSGVGEVRRDSLAEEKAALKVRLRIRNTIVFPIKKFRWQNGCTSVKKLLTFSSTTTLKICLRRRR